MNNDLLSARALEPAAPATGAAVSARADEARVGALVRVRDAIARRLRLIFYRLRHPRVRFGRGCDIRRGLWILSPSPARVRIGSRCVLDRQMTIECRGTLTVGDGTIFGHHCTIGVNRSVEIGPDCMIAEMVSIRDHDHRFDSLDVPVRDQGMIISPVRIGRNVWIGSKVTVVKGVTIGDNAVIGANAVVTRDVPPNAVAVGIPAKVIRTRSAT